MSNQPPISDQPSEPTPSGQPLDLRADAIGALLMAISVSSLLHLLTLVGRAAVPGWPALPGLPLLFFAIALLAFYRHRWTRLFRPYGGRTTIYLAELVLIILLVRLVPLLATPERLLALLPRWWSDPATFLFDGPFLVSLLLVGTAWGVGHSFGSAVDLLHLQPGELAPPRGSLAFEQWERAQSSFNHRGAYRQINNLIIAGGLVMLLVLAALGAARPAAELLAEGVVVTGLFLLCGLLLLAWAHVMLLDTLWRADGLSSVAGLRRRWPLWLALILAAVALLALIAPRGYTLDPVAMLLVVLQIAAGLFQLLFFLIALPFVWLASLFGLGTTGTPAPPPSLPPAIARQEGEFPWLAFLRSLGFWLLTAALAIYSLRVLYQSRWGVLRWLPQLPGWTALTRLWHAFWSGLRQRAASLTSLLQPGWLGRASQTLQRSPRRPRPTDPRGWVQFLYLSLIERAGRRGYPRRRGMTAAEYSRELAARLATGETPGGDPAAAQADLDTLTAAFLEARYSRHPVGEQEVSLARRALQRLLSMIRRLAASR